MRKPINLFLLLLGMMIGFACLTPHHVVHATSRQATSHPTPPEPGSPVKALKAAFQERNRKIETVSILAAQPSFPGSPHHLVVAWGIRKDCKFEGKFDDELFGLFVMDASLTKIEKTLDIFASPRWFDYGVRIESATIGEVTIVGKGKTYGDAAIRRQYKLDDAR